MFIYLPIYLSDYVSESRKLTMLQRGALIDLSVLYFQENLRLNYKIEQIYRLVFAFEKEEKEAVDFILENYFEKVEDKPIGLFWVSKSLNQLGDKVSKRLEASRKNGQKGGRGNKKKGKPVGSDLLNLDKNLDENILNETKLNEIKLKENPIYQELAEKLKSVLEAKLNRTIKATRWDKEFKRLIEIDLKVRSNPLADVERVIQAISDNYGKEYFPIIQSASSLRDKFSKLESYLERNKENSNNFENYKCYVR